MHYNCLEMMKILQDVVDYIQSTSRQNRINT